MNIVGISSHYHDSAACLLKDGMLVAAAQEERFSRRKFDPRFPLKALQYCLEEGDISISDIDCVAYYENPVKKLERQVWSRLPRIRSDREHELGRLDPLRPLREVREELGYSGNIKCFSHHLSHAASSYYFSGFSDAAVLTVDAVGEWATASYGSAQGPKLSLFQEVHFPNSLGLLYSTVTSYLGFGVNDGEYKVMGLAPYGECQYLEHMQKLGHVTSDGNLELDEQFFDFSGSERMYTDRFCSLFGQPPRKPESELQSFHCDVARSLQQFLEEALLSMCRYLHDKAPSENSLFGRGCCVELCRKLEDLTRGAI